MEVVKKHINDGKCITFIGMPGAGKSFTSEHISNNYGIPLVELDEVIETKYNMTLPVIIKTFGENNFKKIECDAILGIDLNVQQIISTGGSVIYCEEGMKHLQNSNNVIIYLNPDFEIIKERTENFTNRGIVFNNLTPKELYDSRTVLYKKYADLIFNKII